MKNDIECPLCGAPLRLENENNCRSHSCKCGYHGPSIHLYDREDVIEAQVTQNALIANALNRAWSSGRRSKGGNV